MDRYRDEGSTLWSFRNDVLVVCPSCGACAHVVSGRGTCTACAWTQSPRSRSTRWGGAVDPYLELPLWLKTPVGGEVLWAFNGAHLDLLDAYVAADLRERVTDRTAFTLVEKLPAWVKSAKNRDAVLAGLARLRERLAEAS